MKFKDWLNVVGIAALAAWVAVIILEVNLDIRLDNAYNERGRINARLDQLEAHIISPTPTPTPWNAYATAIPPTATPTPTPTTEPFLREVDIWPELAYDGVIDDKCRRAVIEWAERKYDTPSPNFMGDILERPLRQYKTIGSYYLMQNLLTGLVNDGDDDTVVQCQAWKLQIELFLRIREQTMMRWYPQWGGWGNPYPVVQE